jgi:hypothetical protein
MYPELGPPPAGRVKYIALITAFLLESWPIVKVRVDSAANVMDDPTDTVTMLPESTRPEKIKGISVHGKK